MGEVIITHLRRGALLHDVGKIGVKDSILLKPTRFTEEEMTEMKRHPQLAYEMLKDIPYLKQAIDVPHYHHEQWDGGGYPDGLQGDDIPMLARIFTVVDIWDAMISDRVYRKALSKDFTLKYIQAQSGKIFDPNIAPKFIEFMEKQSGPG